MLTVPSAGCCEEGSLGDPGQELGTRTEAAALVQVGKESVSPGL